MKTKYEEKLDEVSLEQAEKLKKIGFNWVCEKYYDKDGIECNLRRKEFGCWKPTIALALKFITKKFGVSHNVYSRDLGGDGIGFSINFTLKKLGIAYADLSAYSKLEDEDGVITFDRDEIESIALDMELNFLLENFKSDFSWLQKGIAAYRLHDDTPVIIEDVDHEQKVAKFNGHWAYFRIFNKEQKFEESL